MSLTPEIVLEGCCIVMGVESFVWVLHLDIYPIIGFVSQ